MKCHISYESTEFMCCQVRLVMSRVLCVFSRRYGNYLCVLYLFTKALYLANVLGQLALLGEWLGDGYYYYGLEVSQQL